MGAVGHGGERARPVGSGDDVERGAGRGGKPPSRSGLAVPPSTLRVAPPLTFSVPKLDAPEMSNVSVPCASAHLRRLNGQSKGTSEVDIEPQVDVLPLQKFFGFTPVGSPA